MKSDSEIANSIKLDTIDNVATKCGIKPEDIVPYTRYMGKVPLKYIDEEHIKKSKLILVTSISPTKAGIGKTTTSIGLAMGLRSIGENAIAVLREPSLGPCFGMKGGACGGGYAQILPMDKINLHFTGDFHAITSANNLIACCLDNYFYQHPEYPKLKHLTWKRVMDMNDRGLRNIIVGLNNNGGSYESGFDITPASEIMAILCLTTSIEDLYNRIDNIILGYTFDNKPFLCKTLGITGSVVALLKDALMPNLVQMSDNNPCLVHGGPFANIAHGCNSVLATKMGMSLCDYVVTEAGFGADLGAEKFIDIKCRLNGLNPDLVVIAITMEGLSYHSSKDNIPTIERIHNGISNLVHHLQTLKYVYNMNVVVAINKHSNFDTQEMYDMVMNICTHFNMPCVVNDSYANGAKGSINFASCVRHTINNSERPTLHYAYALEDDVQTKILDISQNVYGVSNIKYSPKAYRMLERFKSDLLEYAKMPICIAKTQYSLSDNPKLLGEPTKDTTITINDIIVNGGAGFIVVIAGEMMRMPGLPKIPMATKIGVDENNGEYKVVNLS